MDLLLPSLGAAATLVLLTVWWRLRRHRQHRPRVVMGRPGAYNDPAQAAARIDALQPQAVRVLTIDERQAYDLLRRALPGALVLAQVPLARFLRVTQDRDYPDWLQQIGLLSCDLLLCDSGSRVLVAVDIVPPQVSDGARRRHERLQKALRSAGIHVLVWHEQHLPTLAEVRQTLAPLLGALPPAAEASSRPMGLDPLAAASASAMAARRAALERQLAAGDVRHALASDDPVPSGFFEPLPEAAR